MFEDPPSWTTPIANLTAWFDWEALGAIGTVGALWYAVVQGYRSARFERLRAAAELTRLLELIGPIAEYGVPDQHDPDDEHFVQSMYFILVQDGALAHAADSISGMTLSAVPDVSAHAYLENLKQFLPQWKTRLIGEDGVISPDWGFTARIICEAADYFRLLRSVYLTGSLRARLALRRRFS